MVIFFALLLSLQSFALNEAVGSYTNGSLIDGDCLPQEGEGYMQLYRETNHIWATSPMLTMLTKTAAEIDQRFPGKDRLQIEEMSAKNGGEVDGHGSHENGLDVDLQYYKADGKEHDPKTAAQYYADPMVKNGSVSANFDLKRNWELMKTLHKHGDVQRIFIDQKLKNALCAYAKANKDYASNIQVLRSMRHVTNHADHLHVRLGCPPKDKKCIPQPPPPAGSGCP